MMRCPQEDFRDFSIFESQIGKQIPTRFSLTTGEVSLVCLTHLARMNHRLAW